MNEICTDLKIGGEMRLPTTSGEVPFPLAEALPLPEPGIEPELLEEYLAAGETISKIDKPTITAFSSKLKSGCYRIAFTPAFGRYHYHGTLRAEVGGGNITASGDLYRYGCRAVPPHCIDLARGPDQSPGSLPMLELVKSKIPVFPRDQYYSYLKIVGVKTILRTGEIRMSIEEHIYNAAAENFTLDRIIEAKLKKEMAPAGFSTAHYFAGKLYHQGIELGTFTMGWISKYFRGATLEIDTITGAVAPQPVEVEGKKHSFRSIFKTAGWDLKVLYSQTDIPNTFTGGSVDWTYAQLHEAMQAVRKPTTDLDKEWRLHLLAVPENMGSGRGVMFDQIGAPREGVASFSDDGYPRTGSVNWGSAEDKLQKEVPEAFLRSAAHEVGHGFNMQHQSLIHEGETGNDATVMTTSPSVANFLSINGKAFPDDIEFGFNSHVRRHLVHFPDIVVRPGGASWRVGHATEVPETDQDRNWYLPDELDFEIQLENDHLALGEPLEIELTLRSCVDYDIIVPERISPEYGYTRIIVIDPQGNRKPMPTFALHTDAGTLVELQPLDAIKGVATVFWSSRGFAFEQSGRHTIEIQTTWNFNGVAYGIVSRQQVWIDAAVSEADNEIASLLLRDEVGIWVMLGGADHIENAPGFILAASKCDSEHAACKRLIKYDNRRDMHQLTGKPTKRGKAISAVKEKVEAA